MDVTVVIVVVDATCVDAIVAGIVWVCVVMYLWWLLVVSLLRSQLGYIPLYKAPFMCLSSLSNS